MSNAVLQYSNNIVLFNLNAHPPIHLSSIHPSTQLAILHISDHYCYMCKVKIHVNYMYLLNLVFPVVYLEPEAETEPVGSPALGMEPMELALETEAEQTAFVSSVDTERPNFA